MFQKLKIAIIAAAMTLAPAALVATPAAAQDIQGGLNCGAQLTFNAESGSCESSTDSGAQLDGIIETIINILSIVIGVVSVIMIIIGGFKYIVSGGDSSAVTGAKNTILYAIIGLVVVALAQVIVQFVLSSATTVAT